VKTPLLTSGHNLPPAEAKTRERGVCWGHPRPRQGASPHMRGLKRFLAACGGGRGEGETGDTPDPGRGLRPLHPLKSALIWLRPFAGAWGRPPVSFSLAPAGRKASLQQPWLEVAKDEWIL